VEVQVVGLELELGPSLLEIICVPFVAATPDEAGKAFQVF
jgi:hypothetical protein